MLDTFLVVPKKKEIVAQSIAAAEFIAATAPGNQALWIKKILCGLWLEMKESTKICVGKKVASAISHNPIFHRKTIHFNVTLYILREVQGMV